MDPANSGPKDSWRRRSWLCSVYAIRPWCVYCGSVFFCRADSSVRLPEEIEFWPVWMVFLPQKVERTYTCIFLGMLNFNLQRENLLFLTRHWKKNLRIFFRFQPVLTGLATIPGMAQRCCDQGVLVEDVRRSFNHQLRIYIDQVLESSRSTLKHPETIIPLHPISFSIFFRSGGVVGPCFDEAIAIFALDECPTTACWPGGMHWVVWSWPNLRINMSK